MEKSKRRAVTAKIIKMIPLQAQRKSLGLKLLANERLSNEVTHQTFALAFSLIEQSTYSHCLRSLSWLFFWVPHSEDTSYPIPLKELSSKPLMTSWWPLLCLRFSRYHPMLNGILKTPTYSTCFFSIPPCSPADLSFLRPCMPRMCPNPISFFPTKLKIYKVLYSALPKLPFSFLSSSTATSLFSLLKAQPGGVCSHGIIEKQLSDYICF